MSLQLCVSYMNKQVIHTSLTFNFVYYDQSELKVEIQNDPNEQITTFTESSVP